MKRSLILGLIAFCSVYLTSCMKEYECKCPANVGIKATVKTTGKKAAKQECEDATGGVCTL